MRSFSFTAKNIGDERYLTYVLGEGTEIDEDVLDYMEEENLAELIHVVYEEDDDYDYLTYDVSGKVELAEFVSGRSINKAQLFTILRNVSIGLVMIREEAIHLSYILLHKKFIYIDPETYSVQFLCLPVESDGSIGVEFKGFVRQLIANMKFNVNEDLAYIGQLLTYINSDSFNLRGLISLTEALMLDAGIRFDEEDYISTIDGTEIVNNAEGTEGSGVGGYMNGLSDSEENLPEIGDDDDEEEDKVEQLQLHELEESVNGEEESAEEEVKEEQPAEESGKKRGKKNVPKNQGLTEYLKNEDIDEVIPNRPHVQTKNIKVNRAALVQSAAEETDGIEVTEESRKRDSKDEVIESIDEASGEQKAPAPVPVVAHPSGILSNDATIAGTIVSGGTQININPYLIRVNTEEKIVINKGVFKIGKANRGVDYSVSGNGAISRQHAIITHKEDGYYIRDNKSTNHTYVNNEQVEEGQEVLLHNNCKIKLGDEEFLYKLG